MLGVKTSSIVGKAMDTSFFPSAAQAQEDGIWPSVAKVVGVRGGRGGGGGRRDENRERGKRRWDSTGISKLTRDMTDRDAAGTGATEPH